VEPDVLLAVVAACLIAGLVKGATGLGFSTTCLPLLALAIGLEDALPLVILPSFCSNVLIMRAAGHFRETVIRFCWLYLSLLPGIAAGLFVLSEVGGGQAAAVLGVVLIVYGAHGLARPPKIALSSGAERWMSPVTGICTGFVNGLTGSQVMPLLPFVFALKLDPNRLVQTINISFTLSSVAMAAGLYLLGLFNAIDLGLSAIGTVPALGGAALGNAARKLLSPELFRRLVLVVLVALGAVLIWRAFV